MGNPNQFFFSAAVLTAYVDQFLRQPARVEGGVEGVSMVDCGVSETGRSLLGGSSHLVSS